MRLRHSAPQRDLVTQHCRWSATIRLMLLFCSSQPHGAPEVCTGLPDQRKGPRRDGDYTMADIGLAAFSIFLMGSPSFLGHQQAIKPICPASANPGRWSGGGSRCLRSAFGVLSEWLLRCSAF